ncbi:MAG: FtsX-like permease family protein [Blautia sp.]
MKTVTKTALANIRLNRSKNILIGIAISLTTLLLFLIPSIGFGMMDIQYEAINRIYPTYHGMYQKVPTETVEKIKAVKEIEKAGLRCDPGMIPNDEYTIYMTSLDKTCAEFMRFEPSEGHFPEKSDEILVSKGLLKAMGLEGKKVGDTITLPYQIQKKDGLDFRKEKTFVICGMSSDSKANEEAKQYTACVSDAFVKEELSEAELTYDVYFRLPANSHTSMDAIKANMEEIGESLGIPKDYIISNDDYLGANYVDPMMNMAIVVIMLIVVFAGMITLYSIYYISMIQILVYFLEFETDDIQNQMTIQLIRNQEVSCFYPWLYILTVMAAFLTVYLSLLKPMSIAAKISPIEALRYNGESTSSKGTRKGYEFLTLFRLTKSNLLRNKKRTLLTVFSIGITGIFFMAVSTVLSCANPKEAANMSIEGEYEVSVITEAGNKEHPELEWNQVMQNNPLTDKVIEQFSNLDGVKKVEPFSYIAMSNEDFLAGENDANLTGMPETYAKKLEDGLVEGHITYEEMKNSNKVILNADLLHWYPDLSVGDNLDFQYMDGDVKKEVTLEIAAIGNYPVSLVDFADFITAQEFVEQLSQNNCYDHLAVFSEEKHNAALEKQIEELCHQTGGLELTRTWQSEYITWKQGISFISTGCYLFLGVLGLICIMNLINTMINSIHMRKKELGIMQAIGLSEKQLIRMLHLESLFYTAGAVLCSVGIGSVAGYLIFLYAKERKMFNITYYHYPVTAVIGIILAMALLQLLLVTVIGKSMKKESLMDRIRFSE